MNQKPRKEELRELKSKTFLGGAWSLTPLEEACNLGARCFGNRPPFI